MANKYMYINIGMGMQRERKVEEGREKDNVATLLVSYVAH